MTLVTKNGCLSCRFFSERIRREKPKVRIINLSTSPRDEVLEIKRALGKIGQPKRFPILMDDSLESYVTDDKIVATLYGSHGS